MTEKDDAERIANTLTVNTMDGKLKWSTSIEDDEYQVDSSRFRYFVKSRDEDSLPPYRLQVFMKDTGAAGLLLEVTTTSEDRSLISSLQQLYEAAKRSASGLTDSLPNEVLKDLGELN